MTRFADTFLQGSRIGLDSRSDAERLALAREAEARRAAIEQMRAEEAAQRLELAQAGLDERSRMFDEKQALAGQVASWREEQGRAKMEAEAAKAEALQQKAEREDAGRRALALMVGGQGGISGEMFGPPSPDQSAQVDALARLPASALATMANGAMAAQRKSRVEQIDAEARKTHLRALERQHTEIENDIAPGGRAHTDPVKRRHAIEKLSNIRRNIADLERIEMGITSPLPPSMYAVPNPPAPKPVVPNAAAVRLLQSLKTRKNLITSQLSASTQNGALSAPTPTQRIFADMEKRQTLTRSQAEKYLSDIEPLIAHLESTLMPQQAQRSDPFDSQGVDTYEMLSSPQQNNATTSPTPNLSPAEEDRAAELMDLENLSFEEALARVQGEREQPD